LIRFRSLTLRWGESPPVVQNLDLAVLPGKILTLVGPSGCGKTTLLKAASGLLAPGQKGLTWSGEVEGQNPAATAIIFQDLGLLPWKTVEQNVGLPLKWRGIPDRHDRVKELLEEFGLTAAARAYPSKLSGGMAQRAAIARALALRPSLLLMDEPFSALDALTREKAQQTLWELWRHHGPTVVLVTHSIDEALALGHSVAVLTGQGPCRLAGMFGWDFDDGGPAARRADPEFFRRAKDVRQALEGEP